MSSINFKQTRVLVFLLCAIAGSTLPSCTTSTDLPRTGGGINTSPALRMISGTDLLSPVDTTPIHAFLFFRGTKALDIGSSSVIATAAAVFLDTTDAILPSVSTVQANSKSLLKGSNEVVYNAVDNAMYIPGTTTRVAWNITGYLGGSLADYDTLPSAISITNHSAGDSVSKASGFTLNYTGFNTGDVIGIANYDAGMTKYYVDSTATYNSAHGAVTIHGSDNGSITFTSSNLSTFSTGVMINVSVKHWEYHDARTTGGVHVGVASLISEDIPLFLKP